ncbi:hypothetical protein [Brachyspira innocens]|uniref:hypothetical protein n=1 Tax=Brachyspira innocens TaxID=13264 RepID=UPI00037B3B3D|nr:hypothetical protein [Brachyspira innocens]
MDIKIKTSINKVGLEHFSWDFTDLNISVSIYNGYGFKVKLKNIDVRMLNIKRNNEYFGHGVCKDTIIVPAKSYYNFTLNTTLFNNEMSKFFWGSVFSFDSRFEADISCNVYLLSIIPIKVKMRDMMKII